MSIRYGIISTAQIVPRFVAGVNESEDGVVTAIASRNLEKAQQVAQELAIPTAYGSYQELYEDDNVDIVYVATYNKGHYEATKNALLAGKHVLVEKPFTLSWDEADELFELAKQQNCFLMEAQKAVFLPITQYVKKLIQEKQLGDVRYLRSFTAYPNVDHISWFDSLDAGGGALHGSGSYGLQYMLYVTGTEIEEAAGTALIEPGKTDSQCDVSVLLTNNIQGNVFVTTNFGSDSQLTIFGNQGQVVIPKFWKTQEATVTINGESEHIHLPHQSEFVFEVNHVNECLAKGLTESPIMTKDLTLQTIELVEKMYEQWVE